MQNIELCLDPETLEKARSLAESHQWDLSELVTHAIEQFAAIEAQNYPLLGLFSDDPDSVDEMMNEVTAHRLQHPLNRNLGKSSD